MAVRRLKTSECGCTQFTLDCEEAFWYWKQALGARLESKQSEQQAAFDKYRRHKQMKVRSKVTAETF